ncbi:unnamed protein product [Caenorhabditis angaria]|uniref:SGNH hydrolase-type esterase domain-containing protein n=1 Tax=Caenorhabditis angaria TaxID=860376 RepID=A0A9P1MYZ0_9PELO|nr:unnamed protein product [Caenorhabditis angaria]
MFFKNFLFLPALGFAIIFPPDPKIFEGVKEFNDWRVKRDELINLTDYKFGWPDFACETLLTSGDVPKNVHKITPSDIGIIAALGDSVSVAQAAEAETVSELLNIYPGSNFVSGGDVRLDQQATLFNIFHQYNEKLRGASSSRIKKFYDFNFAVAGQTSDQLVNQTLKLVERLQNRLPIEEFQNSWKFVNIFIGHNDFCKICLNSSQIFSAQQFGKSINQSLNIIKENIPKVFVNIMPPINVFIHEATHKTLPFCETVHRKTCPCILELSEVEFDSIKKDYDLELKNVIEKIGRNDTFDVVLSPAIDLDKIPQIGNTSNLAFIALDCFHLSSIAHDISAKQIWKGLFQYVNHKENVDFETEDFSKVQCPPKECSYLRTIENSKNCQYSLPTGQTRELLMGGKGKTDGFSGISLFFILAMFVVGTTLILIFTKYSFSTQNSIQSQQFENERRRLLPIARTDLDDNLF